MDLHSRTLPPAPRIPTAANPTKLPPVDTIAAYAPQAAKVVESMHRVFDTAWAAIEQLEACRPDGAVFRATEDEAVKANDPAILAEMLAGEPMRYADAVVKSRRAVADQDGIREAGRRQLTAGAVKVREAIDGMVAEFEAAAAEAWEDRDTTPGLVALDRADQLHHKLQTATALVAWLDGVDRAYIGSRANPADSGAKGQYLAARLRRDGKHVIEFPAGFDVPRGWEAPSVYVSTV